MYNKNRRKFNHFVKKVRLTKNYKSVIKYVKKNKDLTAVQLFNLTKLLCESKKERQILDFYKASYIADTDICCLNKIANVLSSSDNPEFISEFASECTKIGINDKLIDRLCKLKEIDKILFYLKNSCISTNSKRKIISTIIEHGSLEQVIELSYCYDILTKDECKKISSIVCSSSNEHYICLVSALFTEEDKTPFVNAICKTEDTEMLYCFVAYNKNLDESHIEKVIDKICNINNIEYIYKSLLLLGNTYPNLRKKLLESIKNSNNLKYMTLTTIYFDKDYLVKEFDFVQGIYEKAVMSEGIFTDNELIDMYKHMQKVKNESSQLVKQKVNNR